MSQAVRAPWLSHFGEVPATLSYFSGTMYEAVEQIAAKYPDNIALDFMGRRTSYRALCREVEVCARALRAIGVRAGDRVTICMPNCPQAVVLFYAVNLVGGISNMVHPLSGEKEIEFYLRDSESVCAATLDQFYEKFAAIRANVPTLRRLILTGVGDALSPVKRAGYALTQGRKIPQPPKAADLLRWREFLALGKRDRAPLACARSGADPAVILYSGGTTGVTKGILLSNLNFNALGQQIIATNPMFRPGDKMLAAMPMFHGFGLGVSIHAMLSQGGRCILVPRFTPDSYSKLLCKEKCNFIAAVPTLYEALLRSGVMQNADLSFLKGVFSGGDSLSVELKKRVDRFLAEHHSSVQVREGYGTTECVTASCLTPYHMAREGSIGLPFPDTYYKIVKVGTQEEQPYGAEGEICIAGPTVMMGYVGQPEETAQTLQTHADGLTWVHTGDLGVMDADGFVYFRQRIKRMIITNGYNVYPSQLENVLDAHELVQMSCVIGVPDPVKQQRVKAFVMLKPDLQPCEAYRQAILAHCRKYIAKYAMPYEIEFRDSLPKTLVGKVAYRELEAEELEKLRQG